jgi:hypothetical protein
MKKKSTVIAVERISTLLIITYIDTSYCFLLVKTYTLHILIGFILQQPEQGVLNCFQTSISKTTPLVTAAKSKPLCMGNQPGAHVAQALHGGQWR